MFKELVALKFVTEDKKTVIHISVIYTGFDSRVAIQCFAFKVTHENIGKQGTLLRPIISQIGSYTYELAKFLVPILMPLTTNQYTVKDSFSFVNSLMSLQNVSFMASFDVVSLFTNIPLNETIELCLDKLYTDTDLVHSLPRKTLKTLLN